MSTATRARVAAGVPTGGQFSASARSEVPVSLGSAPLVSAAPETVTVKDRHGKPVTLTPGVLDSEARYAYSSGQCLALAIAASEETGWPVYLRMANGLIGNSRTPKDYIIHAMVQRPDGLLVDANGATAPGKWIESGKEIDAQVVPADQAAGLLKTHMAGMKPQDVETARTFVSAVVAQAEAPAPIQIHEQARINWARDDHQAGPGQAVCSEVSQSLAAYGLGDVVEGTYHGPDAAFDGMAHDWVRRPDGSILDATADQFSGSEDEPVRLIGPDDERYGWYQS